MANGFVVDHKESGVRYAVSEVNFDSSTMKKVRQLKPEETVRGFQPLAHEPLGDQDGPTAARATAGELTESSDSVSGTTALNTKHGKD